MPSDVTLVEDQLGTLELSEANGYSAMELDLGFPAAREAAVDRVNTHGTDDHTAFYGARAVSLRVQASVGSALETLRAFASPARRPVLLFRHDLTPGEPDRRVRLRGSQLGAPLVDPISTTTQVQWVAPDGIIESAVEHTVTVPAVPDTEAGRTYPRSYPLTYPAISAIGAVTVANEGTEPAAPVLRLWGPCVDPWVVNLATGETLELAGLELTASQYAEVDVREATVRLQGRPTESLYASLTLGSALWWLQPGVNEIRYTPASFGSTARADVIFRSAWI